MPRFKILILVCFSLLLLLIFGFLRFSAYINSYEAISNINIQGIAVLTGGKGRIDKGIKAFRKNPESILLISGVDKTVEKTEIVPKDFLNKRTVLIDKKSETTIQNADEIINWANKNKINNIEIITSDYYMPRSIYILKKKAKELNFYANPVVSDMKLSKIYYGDFNTINFLFEEYIKFLLSLVIY